MNVHEWREDILPAYEIRKTKRQKTAFIDHLAEIYGSRMQVEEWGTLVKSRNIVLGNPDTASVIYTAHYDTCARVPFPNFITPKNIALYLLYQILLGLVMVVTLQAMMHIFVSVNFFPETGQTLPFISRGGSSMLFATLAMAIVLGVSRQNDEKSHDKPRGESILERG